MGKSFDEVITEAEERLLALTETLPIHTSATKEEIANSYLVVADTTLCVALQDLCKGEIESGIRHVADAYLFVKQSEDYLTYER